MVKQHVVGIRLDPKTKQALQALAERDSRTLSNLVAKICRDYHARVAPFHEKKKAATSPS